MGEKPTGTCRRCGRVFKLTKRDGIWSHGNGVTDPTNPYYRQNCPGSGQDPKERLRADRQRRWAELRSAPAPTQEDNR